MRGTAPRPLISPPVTLGATSVLELVMKLVYWHTSVALMLRSTEWAAPYSLKNRSSVLLLISLQLHGLAGTTLLGPN